LFFLLVLLATPCQAAVTLVEATGRVFFLKSGSSGWGQVSSGQVVSPGDQVRTASGSRATVLFEDGTRAQIGPNGTFTLQESSPSAGATLKLGLGSLRAWVSKAVSKRFEVRTPTAVCSVRGTEFEVRVDGRGDTNVQMFSGLLAVADTAGNEVLLKDDQKITVTDKGLGQVGAGAPSQGPTDSKERQALKREVGLEMSKEEVQAAAAIEARNAIYQQGKAIIDVNGNRVRIEEYIIRPTANQFKLVVLNERSDRFDYFYYTGTFNQALPDDISIALRQLPGCIGQMCDWWMTGYQTGRSNTIDNMLEITSGGHPIDVNNNGVGSDDVTAAYDPATDQFISLAAGTPFFKTLFDTYVLTFNGVEHGRWGLSAAGLAQPLANGGRATNYTGDITQSSGGTYTTVQTSPGCSPPDCTYTENGVMHSVVYAANGAGTTWERYDNYIISDEGKVATSADFAGATTGTLYKQRLLGWNFQTIVTASEFGGRKIDLAVEPKIFIQSGLIP
jgi:hypothetical protein